MNRFLDWRANARAGLLAAACVLAMPAIAQSSGKLSLRGSVGASSPQAVEPHAGPPLKFFTIAQRVATLRASGNLPEASTDDKPMRPSIVTASLVIEPPQAPTVRPLGDTVLGMSMLPVPGGELSDKWRAMEARWESERALIQACETGPCQHRGAARWVEIAEMAGKRSGREQLAFVHASINRSISYASDFVAYGVADYWASPLESIGKLGDCEDYGIAKYMMLRQLGYQAEDLKLVVLFQPWSGLHHAILAVRNDERWTYLDNQRVELTAESDYRGVRPIATLDENGQSMLAALPKMLETVAFAPPSMRGPR
jgi:predicted transglutaminase-like cysteine proteinase